MNPHDATREIAWNIPNAWIMYVLLIPALLIAGYGLYQRVTLWRRGTALNRLEWSSKRMGLLVRQIFLQSRIARYDSAKLFHRFILWGFLVLLAATGVVLIQYDFNVVIMKGYFYLIFQSFIVDICGAMALIGIVIAAYRRWISRPSYLEYATEANLILVILFLIMLTGFLLEGWRIAATDDPWAAWSPVGYMVAQLSAPVLNPEKLALAHRYTWWFHLLLVFGLIAWAPYTKMIHVVTSALNTYAANLDPIGANLKQIDIEEVETLGVNTLEGFTWKDLLDLDACTSCGRCTDNCPANISGKDLSPRDLILDLRKIMDQPGKSGSNGDGTNLFPNISADTLWECTTCAACVEACPVYVEQMPKIVDMRRYQVMEEAEFPETMMDAVMSMEDRGHPFRGTRATRLDWAKGLDVPLMADAPDAEILLWVGSAGALVERSQQVMQALVKLLTQAGVRFAILGREEKSTGDLARRVGNEFLFTTLVEENINTLAKYNIKTILTACPHSYNTLKNEYPNFGGNYTVYHHTEYLAQLVKEKRLNIPNTITKRVTYHDPCYLSRHNGMVEAPRYLIERALRVPYVELEKHSKNSFCCGGGGGLSFAEEPTEKRVNRFRARQCLEANPEIVTVACPFCMTMLDDGIKAEQGDREVRVADIAELLLKAIELKKNNN